MNTSFEAKARLKRAAQWIKNGNPERAAALVASVLRVEPHNPDALYLAAILTPDPGKKVVYLDQALKVNPQHAARALLAKTDPDGSLLAAARAQREDRQSAETKLDSPRRTVRGALLGLGLIATVLVVGSIVLARALLPQERPSVQQSTGTADNSITATSLLSKTSAAGNSQPAVSPSAIASLPTVSQSSSRSSDGSATPLVGTTKPPAGSSSVRGPSPTPLSSPTPAPKPGVVTGAAAKVPMPAVSAVPPITMTAYGPPLTALPMPPNPFPSRSSTDQPPPFTPERPPLP